ncbi:formamidopyrimidine-DNA glycosylase [Striga asiatica]|uniref:Formamidopyrimidine-DNA glycosylase n=1 Tax=Striga asiatica TaxID=4170 RepID=A0A5A7R7D4_STRAF|nr:formamidopyrimidine-DNA glycosylase [Striga asiatica]
MDDNDPKTVPSTKPDIKTGSEEKVEPSPVLELEPSTIESVLKPVVEEFSEGAKTLVTSCVDHMEKGLVEKLGHVNVSESLFKLPTSDEKVGESSSESAKPESVEKEERGLEENPRSTDTNEGQPVTAGTRASWINCCGLLDVLRPSDH